MTKPTETPKALQTSIRTLLDTYGVLRTSKALGISREATTRLATGLPVRPGTIVLAEKSISGAEKRLASGGVR